MITSLTNAKVKEWTKLNLKKYRKDNYLIFDDKTLLKAYEHGLLKEVVYVGNKPLAFENSYEVSKEVMAKITKGSTLQYVGIGIRREGIKKKKDRIIVLDDLKDPQNVGMILKGALLFGFDTVLLSKDTADIYHPKCLKAAEGALFDLNIVRGDLEELIASYKKEGFEVLATGLKKNTKELAELHFDHKYLIVLGNEGSGVSDKIYALSDVIFKIAMENIDSLNVAIAGSIIMEYFFNTGS